LFQILDLNFLHCKHWEDDIPVKNCCKRIGKDVSETTIIIFLFPFWGRLDTRTITKPFPTTWGLLDRMKNKKNTLMLCVNETNCIVKERHESSQEKQL
jgi:hypothetical protein